MLDILHAVEHLAVVSRTLYEDSDDASLWLETAGVGLFEDGYFGIYELYEALKNATSDEAVAVDNLLSSSCGK